MRNVRTTLDVETQFVIIELITDDKIYRMGLNLAETIQKLEAIGNNPILRGISELLGMKIEVEKKETRRSAEVSQKPV